MMSLLAENPRPSSETPDAQPCTMAPSWPVFLLRFFKGTDSFYFPCDPSISYRNNRALTEKPRWGSCRPQSGPYQPGLAPLSPQGLSLEPLGADWRVLEIQENREGEGDPAASSVEGSSPELALQGRSAAGLPVEGGGGTRRGAHPPCAAKPLDSGLGPSQRKAFAGEGPLALWLWTHDAVLANQPPSQPCSLVPEVLLHVAHTCRHSLPSRAGGARVRGCHGLPAMHTHHTQVPRCAEPQGVCG